MKKKKKEIYLFTTEMSYVFKKKKLGYTSIKD